RPDPTVWDGRFANNGWLQELPKPLTLLTWENVAMISAAMAVRLKLAPLERIAEANGRMVELTYKGRKLKAPVWVTPGHPEEAVTVFLGYGRARAGHVGAGKGFNAYRLRSSDSPWFGRGMQIAAVSGQTIHPLATSQLHQRME